MGRRLDAVPNYEVTVSSGAPHSMDTGSFFGHDPKLQGLDLVGLSLPAHLVLSLDNHDPNVSALNIDVGPTIRLVHPFFYDQAERFSYRHLSRNEVEFPKLSLTYYDDWPSPNFPRVLPTREIRFRSVQGKPVRKLDKSDVLDDFSTIFVGSESPTTQDHSDKTCAACGAGSLQLIASLPNRPIPELDIWKNDFLFVLFWYCSACKAITTSNECD